MISIDVNILTDYQMANNSSNESVMTMEDPYVKFSYYGTFFTLFYLLPIFTVNILLLVAIIRVKTIPATVRLILGNIVASSEVIIVGWTILNMIDLILPHLRVAQPHDFPCRLVYVLIDTGAAGRLLFMATYAVTVYVLALSTSAKLRTNQLKLWHSSLAVVGIWLLATLPNTVLLSPSFLQITFPNNYVCITHFTGAPTFIHSSFFIIVYGLCCFVPSILFPILTARIIKKCCISENKETLKGMTKFSAFLLLGNSFNMIGITLPIFLAIFTPLGEVNFTLVVAFVGLNIVFLGLSLLTTPIIVLIFFKRVREKFKMIVCCICLKVAAK